MRAASAATAGTAAALLLLTWLLARGIDVDARPFDRAFAALADIELAEGAMDRDVLSARAGLLRDYDALAREARLMEDAVERLREPVADAAPVDRLAAWLARREPLLEEFKSANAVLQNSLTQFGRLSGRLAAPDAAGSAVPGDGAIGSLASAVLRLTLDTSPEAAREVARELDRLAPRVLMADATEPGAALLAHGTLLHELLPTADRALRALLAAPSGPEREAVRASVLARRDAAERTARRYRVLLYAASVLLLGLLVFLGLRLRARALALRRRAAFDRTLADLSTGLIGTAAAEARTQAERALARIAERVGADRAYLVCAGPPRQEYAWSAPGMAFPAGWGPARALALAGRLRPAADGIIRVVRGERGSRRAGGADALDAAGPRGWLAAVRRDEGGAVAVILGCDIVRPGAVAEVGDLGPLRLALDAVANVVERADLERERSRLEARLERSRRMEALGSFASGIAHNFNNILGAVLGYAEVAEAELASGGRAPAAAAGLAASLDEIRRAGERARDLVEQILAFGRGRAAARRPVGARALVGEAAALLRATLPAGVRLEVGEVPESVVVLADAAQLQQVVVNLCANAAQAMDGGGTVSVGVEERDLDRARESAHGELGPGRYAVVSVGDTGRGMDDATLGRIFEPFFTTREAGHGLGLATVREVVLGHGGAIEVRSAPGAGTRFEVWLPRAADAAEVASPGLAFGRGETLLLVEGEVDRLAGDEELLAALGYEPVGFAAPGEALDAVRAAPGRFDAAVVCHAEPGPAPARAALGFAAELRGAAPGLPVVLAAASTEGIGAGALASRGVAEVVHWPLACDELAPALRRCLAARSGEPGVASQPVAPRP